MTGINEDLPTNSSGGGSIAGIGIGPQGEPPVKKKTVLVRRKRPSFKAFINK